MNVNICLFFLGNQRQVNDPTEKSMQSAADVVKLNLSFCCLTVVINPRKMFVFMLYNILNENHKMDSQSEGNFSIQWKLTNLDKWKSGSFFASVKLFCCAKFRFREAASL